MGNEKAMKGTIKRRSKVINRSERLMKPLEVSDDDDDVVGKKRQGNGKMNGIDMRTRNGGHVEMGRWMCG